MGTYLHSTEHITLDDIAWCEGKYVCGCVFVVSEITFLLFYYDCAFHLDVSCLKLTIESLF